MELAEERGVGALNAQRAVLQSVCIDLDKSVAAEAQRENGRGNFFSALPGELSFVCGTAGRIAAAKQIAAVHCQITGAIAK